MRKTNKDKSKIDLLRTSIEKLIDVLSEKIEITDDDNGLVIKGAVQVKKNAFGTAKYLLNKLQILETENAKDNNYKWYRDAIVKLIFAAEDAIDELHDVMEGDIKSKDTMASMKGNITAKQDAYDNIDELYSGIKDLDAIVKSIDAGDGLISLDKKDYKTSFAEDFSYEGFYRPMKRKVEAGYNKELDAVVISYDGSVGEIIDCYGLRIALPKAPMRNSFENNRKKPSLTYWERPKLPQKLNSASTNLFMDVINEEFYRRDNGYWFLNNGEPEYVTGAHYMLLTHLKTDADGGYFHYRKAHRDLFYFLEATWVDTRSMGTILGKTRRTGATYIAAAFLLTKGISIRNVNLGLTSKKDRDAKAVFDRIITMFKNMTFFFKPINTGEGLGGALRFITPSTRTTKNNQKKDAVYEDLNTVIDYQPSTEDSYDSMTMKLYIGDEFSKWLNSNILNHWEKVKKTLTKGGNIHGKAFILSTVEYVTGKDHDDDGAKSGDRFKHLYYNSQLEDRNEFGMTKSGLYKIFIPADENYEGFIDMYGNCIATTPDTPIMGVDGKMITHGVRERLEADWKSKGNDPSALNDAKRKDPLTEDDMFRIASDSSSFDLVKIQDQMDFNHMERIINNKEIYKTGNFVRKTSGEVEFVECSNGRFKISWLPDKEMRNGASIRHNKKSPLYDYVGIFGIDPYKLDRTSYTKGSKGAIIGYLMDHPIDGIPKNNFFLVYLCRPQTKDIFFDDAMMCCQYYGFQALIENNIPAICEAFYNAELTNYVMRRPDKMKLNPDELKYGGIPSSDSGVIRSQAQMIEKYIYDYVGHATTSEHRELDEIGDCPFDELLTDWMKFDVTDRTKYDASVAAGLALYGAHKFKIKNLKSKRDKFNVQNVFNINR